MSEVAALIADMVRAGVDADLIGRTAQALAEREPVFVQAGDAAGVSAEGHDGRSAAAIRQARYRARRAAGGDAGHNAGVTRYASRYGAAETDDGATGPGIASDSGDKATDGEAFDRNAALRCVTGDVTRYGDRQKENTPHTPQEKNSPLKEKAPKGAQKKVPPEPADKGLFKAEAEADLSAKPEGAGRAEVSEAADAAEAIDANQHTRSSSASAGTDRKRRSRRHGGDITGLTAEFDTHVWPLYPQKVARKTAAKAWASARQRADFDTIMDGLKRYVAKRDDRPWCNLSTWLNQDRWTDRPAAAPARAPPSPSGRQSRSEQIRDHNRRVSEALHKRMRQDNGNATADIIDIDRSDWTVEGSA